MPDSPTGAIPATSGPRRRLRLLHTSDVHIAGDAASIEGLRRVIDLAVEHVVDMVLIAGDLFDSARVRDEPIGWTLAELARAGRPVVIIPGNHDCVDESSIYHRVDLASCGDHVHFAGDPAGQELVFDELGLAVWAKGIENHHPAHQPLGGYAPCDPRYWSVVVTHGHYVPTGEVSDRSSPIHQADIGHLQCDYLALGHWHRYLDVSEGAVTAFYCGSPSEPGRDGAGANLVTLDPDAGVSVERLIIIPPSARGM